MHAMVDTGAHSTIISRTALHRIGQQRCQDQKPVLVLEEPTVKLYCKDGIAGGQQLLSWMWPSRWMTKELRQLLLFFSRIVLSHVC